MIADDYQAIAKQLTRIKTEEEELLADQQCANEPEVRDDDSMVEWNDVAIWAWTVHSNSRI